MTALADFDLDLGSLRPKWGWFVALGVVLVVLEGLVSDPARRVGQHFDCAHPVVEPALVELAVAWNRDRNRADFPRRGLDHFRVRFAANKLKNFRAKAPLQWCRPPDH
jgi:hypothetical protein